MSIVCDSAITEVTVHARGALVTRRVALPQVLPAGEVTIFVPDVTVLAEPGSVRAALPEATARTVLAVRAALSVSGEGAVVGASVERVRAMRAALQRINEERARLSELRGQFAHLTLDPGFRARRTPEAPRGIAARTADALAADAMLMTLLADLDARAIDLDVRARRASEALAAEELRDAQARAEERLGEGHPTLTIAVHLTGEGALPWLDVRYAVRAARWWPVYTLRMHDQGRRATWLAEALVAQRSGEDWRNVRLALSTADLLFDARLPELPSLRFGRVQAPAHRGYRAAPAGLDAMFVGYDRAFSRELLTMEATAPGGGAVAKAGVDKGEDVAAGRAVDTDVDQYEGAGSGGTGHEPVGAPLPMSFVAPAERAAAFDPVHGGTVQAPLPASFVAPQPASARADVSTAFGAIGKRAASPGGGGARPDGGAAVDARPIEPEDAWFDFDSLRLSPPSNATSRGRLVRAVDASSAQARARAQNQLDEAVAPIGAKDPLVTRGMFDHRYTVEGLVDVPADALTHRVLIGQREGTPTLRWRTVPREALEVYREAELRNPFDAPLLGGPVEVYVDGSLLAVASIGQVDRGGTTCVGMGVEQRLRVARNVRAREETAGILGGDTVIHHEVSIELSSAFATPALVEVLDRHPVSDDKDIEVEITHSVPEYERYDQAERGAAVRGGMAWRVIVPPGGRTSVVYIYRIKLPSKNEIVGGNRRD